MILETMKYLYDSCKKKSKANKTLKKLLEEREETLDICSSCRSAWTRGLRQARMRASRSIELGKCPLGPLSPYGYRVIQLRKTDLAATQVDHHAQVVCARCFPRRVVIDVLSGLVIIVSLRVPLVPQLHCSKHACAHRSTIVPRVVPID